MVEVLEAGFAAGDSSRLRRPGIGQQGYTGASFPFLFSLGFQLMGQCCPCSEWVSPSLFNLLENTLRYTHECVS